jgi:hypothetical protein
MVATAAMAAMSSVALAAPVRPARPEATSPAPGVKLIANGDFALPGPAKHEGATPTGWKLVYLGVEKKPYGASIGAHNAKGQYPPPAGNPNPSDIADEVFYEAGSSVGIEGIGGRQTAFAVASITQANNPQVSFAAVEVSGPESKLARWAGSGLEIDFTAGAKAYSLIFLDLWTAAAGKFSSKPEDTATTKYVLEATLAVKKWRVEKAIDLNGAIKKRFGLTSYKVKDVRFVNLEDTTDSGAPYPNINGYVADVTVDEGPAS